MTELARSIRAAWDRAERDDPEPTVRQLCALRDSHPDSGEALYAYACALDFAGRPEEAAPAYESAFAVGVPDPEVRSALLQYGSTLRNLGRTSEAVAVLGDAARRFPGDAAVSVYLALALLSDSRGDEAVGRLITLAVDRIDDGGLRRYAWALRRYAAELADDRDIDGRDVDGRD